MMNIMLGNISNNWFLIAYLLFNSFGFLCMWFDKRAAIKRQYRISEKFLFMIALLGSTLGLWIGMLVFHHKTQKIEFTFGLSILLIIQLYLFFILNS